MYVLLIEQRTEPKSSNTEGPAYGEGELELESYRVWHVCTLNRAENRAQKQQHREAGARPGRTGGRGNWSWNL